jgi:hypothetical protein
MVPFTHGDLVAHAVRDFLADLGDRRTKPGSGG